MIQQLAEWDGILAVAVEPYNVHDHSSWAGSEDGSVAIYFRWGTRDEAAVFSSLERGDRYLVVLWGELAVVGGYFSPSRPFLEFQRYVGELELAVRRHSARQVLVLEDFNAKSETWGSPKTDGRGKVLEDTMAACGLTVVNVGSQHTCVRHNGGSIVDVTFASTPFVARGVSE
ncbi:uncharacterized protein LOC109862267 [Pseudomyrmex gracilis]|uniref:uncharacterized protein LOC109862267 n=1 Tax=Pseudomyrmex gracilis TaxID=219809 RepID=UPI000995A0AB|nr:uncharacterized protein LOC109862267 [Pseudomyrmex gracilis]